MNMQFDGREAEFENEHEDPVPGPLVDVDDNQLNNEVISDGNIVTTVLILFSLHSYI